MAFDLVQAAQDIAQAGHVDQLGTGAIVAVITAEAIEWAKTSGWKRLDWINAHSQGLNRFIGGVAAFVAGLGISWTFDPDTGTLVINGLLASSISHAAIQWVQQQVYYRLLIAKRGGAS